MSLLPTLFCFTIDHFILLKYLFWFQAVVRPCGGHAVMLHWSMYNVYGLKPKEVSTVKEN